MKSASGDHERHSLVDSAIKSELQKTVNLKNDVITFICMPGQRIMEQIISAWRILLVDGTQSESPNGENFSPFEWRSPITHSPSTMNNQVIVGSVETSNSYIDKWTIEKWKIWNEPGGAGQPYTPITDPNMHIHAATADRSYNTTGEVLTDSILSTLGFDTVSINESVLNTYVSQWNFGMEWLHARPINILNGVIGDDPNPYAGEFRGYGLNAEIEQRQQSVGVVDKAKDFYLRQFNYHNTLLS